jgi:nucleoside-diphosphate-sugar epimerase
MGHPTLDMISGPVPAVGKIVVVGASGLIGAKVTDRLTAQLTNIAVSAPANGIIEIGGAEYMPLSEFIQATIDHRTDRRIVITDPDARYFGARLEQRTLVTENRLQGATRLDEWLAAVRGREMN